MVVDPTTLAHIMQQTALGFSAFYAMICIAVWTELVKKKIIDRM